MKILATFITILILSSIAMNKKAMKNENKNKVEEKASKLQTNIQSKSEVKKSDPGSILHATAHFTSPKIVPSLTASGPKVEANEVSSGNVFYDGSANLGVLNVQCDVFSTKPSDCVNNNNCGWCGDKTKCIPGTSRGPLSPCLKSTYIYHTNTATWNPLKAGTININHGGAIIHTETPDTSKIFVNKPYN